MSRVDCICNRNIQIISAYVNSRLGHCEQLFEDLPYPSNRYRTPEDFFLNEDEWTTYDNFLKIFRKARDMVGEPYFYFHCGASSAGLRSWGRLNYFVRVFNTPCDGYRKIPFFNQNLNDTKDIDVVVSPFFDRKIGKMRTVLKVAHHADIDVHTDYIADPYRRGLLASIPTIWGLPPARIRQTLCPYDPVVLFNREPEFAPYALDVRMEGGMLTLKHPSWEGRRTVGRRVFLEAEQVNGRPVFFGKYLDPSREAVRSTHRRREAILITETVRVENRILFKVNELFKAPYFILDITYGKLSLLDRLTQLFTFRRGKKESEVDLIETIDRLREEIGDKNQAYRTLGRVHTELLAATHELENYNKNLQKMVHEQTLELRNAKEEVEARVHKQVQELERYNALRRYLSPNFTEKILSGGGTLGAEPQRKMLTILFSDIRNFSSVTESIEPEELFHLLNRYLSEMIALVHQYEGTLNKMIGDGLMIFFGDPIPMADHAQRAVLMAVEMQKKVADIKKEWGHFGHDLGIGIGINTGYMTVGNVGSDMHRDYTVIGNQVNVAARLESHAKSGQILISRRTHSRVEHLIDVENCGKIQVKGIHSPVMTFNVLVR